MEVYLDGKPLEPSSLPDGSLDDLLSVIRADGDRLVVGMRLDGREVTGEAIDTLRRTPLSAAGRLELQTDSARQLTARTLGQVSELLEQTRQHHSTVARLLAGGKTAKAMELLTNCLTVWTAAEQSLQKVCRLVGIDLDAVIGDGPKPADLIGTLRDHLHSVRQGLEARDFVAISDLIEHDMPPLTDLWQRMLADLRQDLLAGA